MALTFAEELKNNDKPAGDTKKDKRGLYDFGYGYGLDHHVGLGSYAYPSYPELHSGVSTVITKEVAVPQPIVVEKHVKVFKLLQLILHFNKIDKLLTELI